MASFTDASSGKPLLFKFFRDDELETLPDPEWLIEGILPLGAFGVLFGTPGVGKTFVALGMAKSIAAGQPWLGREVKKGPVLYIAAEGRSGLKSRKRAWNQEHESKNCQQMFYLPQPVQLADETQLTAFLTSIEAFANEPVLLVIDTLARCFVGFDENLQKDMGKLVAAVDLIRAKTGATVLLVHHAGKPRSGKQGKVVERGSRVLGGAADVMMSVSVKRDGATLNCEKQKEAEAFEAISFRLKKVTTGDDQESCVVVPDDGGTKSVLDGKHEAALDALANFDECSALCKEWRTTTGLPERTFYRVIDNLMEADAVDRTSQGKNTRYTLNMKWVEAEAKRAKAKQRMRTTATAKSQSVH
jgi:hypothetical protein